MAGKTTRPREKFPVDLATSPRHTIPAPVVVARAQREPEPAAKIEPELLAAVIEAPTVPAEPSQARPHRPSQRPVTKLARHTSRTGRRRHHEVPARRWHVRAGTLTEPLRRLRGTGRRAGPERRAGPNATGGRARGLV